jgi:carbamoyl-phosphate synthase small subunit
MGHQVLSLALGAKTYKMKFGHRGANHPIKDELLKQIYMSSQNHGYAVDDKTLPADVTVTHRNLNDQTVAGFYSPKLNCLGIQYHPESHPGPHEAARLFDFFVTSMHKSNKAETKNYDL